MSSAERLKARQNTYQIKPPPTWLHLSTIRVPMPILFKVCFCHRIILRVLIAERKFLQGIWNLAIVIEHPKACVPFRLLGPSHQLVPIPALPYLSVADLVYGVDGGHQSVIGQAHEILAECVEAVVKVRGWHDLKVPALHVGVGFA